MSKSDLDKLFAPRLAEGELELEGVGVAFRFRSLSRAEMGPVRKAFQAGEPEEAERLMVAAALLEPKMTVAEVKRWQEAAPPNEMEPLVEAIGRLSGLLGDPVKEAMATFPER
jgi:hypothetical protein